MSSTTAGLPCPICRSAGIVRFAADGVPIADCSACRHRYADFTPNRDHVDQVYSDEYFHGGGAGYADYLAEARLLRARGRWYARKIRPYVDTGRMIDVGAAAGLFLKGFLDSGWNGEGVEPNAGMARTARERFRLPVTHSKWEDYSVDGDADLVSIVQVLPHFVDPAAALAKAARTVSVGGGVLIETWNAESVTAKLLGRRWHEYSPPSVLHWFSPGRLASFAKTIGLEEVARGRPSKWIEAGHAKSLLKYKLNGSLPGRFVNAAASWIPDRLALPYPAEDLFWMYLRRKA
jgi:SAM-dependent methyltransferase